jgi:hypothetical protein
MEGQRLDTLKYSLDRENADINAEHNGLNPLMLAARLQYPNAVDMLLIYVSINVTYYKYSGGDLNGEKKQSRYWCCLCEGQRVFCISHLH